MSSSCYSSFAFFYRMSFIFSYCNLVECDFVKFHLIKIKLFIQHHLVYDTDICISRNVGRTEINLVKSNNLYFCSLNIDLPIYMEL